MIGSCDNCDRQNVPVSHGFACGMETTQCYICQGEVDPDPHGEMEAKGGPTENNPTRAYCKPDQSCCDFCCGN